MDRKAKIDALRDAVVAAAVAREVAFFEGTINGIGDSPDLLAYMDVAWHRAFDAELQRVGLSFPDSFNADGR